jgi:hypothetical protein
MLVYVFVLVWYGPGDSVVQGSDVTTTLDSSSILRRCMHRVQMEQHFCCCIASLLELKLSHHSQQLLRAKQAYSD